MVLSQSPLTDKNHVAAVQEGQCASCFGLGPDRNECRPGHIHERSAGKQVCFQSQPVLVLKSILSDGLLLGSRILHPAPHPIALHIYDTAHHSPLQHAISDPLISLGGYRASGRVGHVL